MLGQHLAVIHLVDMVSGQDQDVFRLVGAEDVQVLIDRVGGALVPVLADGALLGGQQFDELVEFAAQKAPAALDMLQQGMGLVLGQHPDAADAGIDAVGQGEVDDAELAGEGNGRFGVPVGQVHQARAAPARQDQGQGAPQPLRHLKVDAIGPVRWIKHRSPLGRGWVVPFDFVRRCHKRGQGTTTPGRRAAMCRKNGLRRMGPLDRLII